jgi:hypothetical protein
MAPGEEGACYAPSAKEVKSLEIDSSSGILPGDIAPGMSKNTCGYGMHAILSFV